MSDKAERYLPLYEAKMMHQFTHRWATYEANGKTREMTLDELRDPHALPQPRYWVDEREVEARLAHWDRGWLLASRDICRTTDERTSIMSIVPRTATSGVNIHHTFVATGRQTAAYYSNFNCFSFDYAVRQKVGGTHLSQNYLKQLPVIPPHTYYDKNRTEQNRTEQNRTEQNRTENVRSARLHHTARAGIDLHGLGFAAFRPRPRL